MSSDDHPVPPVLSETLAKLVVSKSKNQRDAVVHNYAHEHELNHTLKTIDTIRDKTCKYIDFEQRKFVESLSLSSEDLRRVAHDQRPTGGDLERSGSQGDIKMGGSTENLALPGSQTHRSHQSQPRSNPVDIIVSAADTENRLLSQSYPNGGINFGTRSKKRTKNPTKHNTDTSSYHQKDSLGITQDEETVCDPYSISCSMRISDSKGSFEASTGMQGLNAWMGKH